MGRTNGPFIGKTNGLLGKQMEGRMIAKVFVYIISLLVRVTGLLPGEGDLWQLHSPKGSIFRSDKGSSKKPSFCICCISNVFSLK